MVDPNTEAWNAQGKVRPSRCAPPLMCLTCKERPGHVNTCPRKKAINALLLARPPVFDGMHGVSSHHPRARLNSFLSRLQKRQMEPSYASWHHSNSLAIFASAQLNSPCPIRSRCFSAAVIVTKLRLVSRSSLCCTRWTALVIVPAAPAVRPVGNAGGL